jgi:hypothetical protein
VQHEIVEGAPLLSRFAGCINRARAQRHARLCNVFTASKILERGFEVFALAARKKAEPTQINSENGNVFSVEIPRTSQQGPVAAERDQSVEVRWIFEARTLSRYFMQPLLEVRLDIERGCEAKKRFQNSGKLVVALMPDDTEAH